MHNTTTSGLVLFGSFTEFAVTSVEVDLTGTATIPLTIHHRPASTLFNGMYTDHLTINACRDAACNQPLEGSPMAITITYTVTGTDPVTGETGPLPDADATALAVQSRIALEHDVRDAEYSRSLDRIVMAATYPGNALYVYDVATRTEATVPLARAPTAVSISPDGLTAAVGHDGLLSIVDLVQVGQQQPTEPLHVITTADALDVVLDGQGLAHVTPVPEVQDAPVDLHTIEIATGTERRTYPFGFGQVRARHQPIEGHLFIGFQDGSQTEKWDVTGDTSDLINYADMGCSNRFGCGNVWFNESGTRVFTSGGRVIETDGPLNMNLPHIGNLTLSGSESTGGDNLIVWLDHHAARNEIAVVDANPIWCNLPEFGNPCYPRFGTFDSELFTRLSIHSIAPMEIDGTLHIHRGLFVFYKSDGSSKILLSRLDTLSDLDRAYYLSVLE